ncbi:MAG: Type fimbrial assembly protein PilC [Actinomycetia bacterium]|nr:Type fimbrial assembly protein PilC [Actinomycetes bacterium]
MSTFRYVAHDLEGGKQAGTIDASTLVSARYALVSRQLTVDSLKERKSFKEFELTRKKIKLQDIANLSRQLSAFLRAGIPIIDAIETIAEESDKQMKTMLGELASSLRAGEPFSEAIAALHENFPSYYPGIVRSAELSGRLDVVLEQLASYIDRDLATRGKIKSALMYPVILLIMTVIVVIVLVGFVLPKFKNFFKGFGAKLPLTTRMMLKAGDLFTNYWWVLALGVALIVVFGVPYAKSKRGRFARDRLTLRLPVIKEVVRASVVERFCRILSAMVQAGVPIADAMNAAIDSTDNQVFVQQLIPASERMLRGEGLARPLGETGLFPPMVVQMMRVGEETGTLDQQLQISADYYENQLGTKLERLTALFEPVMIVVMGVVVGFVAVALVSAMYGIYNQSAIK